MVCFCVVYISCLHRFDGVLVRAYVVVDLAEDFLGRDDQAHHLPYRHLKVHLGELEQPLEEARHAGFIAARGGRRAEV